MLYESRSAEEASTAAELLAETPVLVGALRASIRITPFNCFRLREDDGDEDGGVIVVGGTDDVAMVLAKYFYLLYSVVFQHVQYVRL